MNLLALPILWYYSRRPGEFGERSYGLVQKMGLSPLIKKRNWKEIERLVISLPQDELSRALEGICSSGEFDYELESYIGTADTDFHHLIAGVYYVYVAWQVRTGQWAKDVGEDQWAGFYKYLGLAEECLNRDYIDPKMRLAAWQNHIAVLMGNGDLRGIEQNFQNCMDENPLFLKAHIAYFTAITPKWLGNKEKLRDYATHSKWSKEISSLLQLIYYIEIFNGEYDTSGSLMNDEAREKFNADYRAECICLLKDLTIPQGDNLLSIFTKNYLAYFYVILGMKKERNELLKELKGKFTRFPWGYFGMIGERDIKLFKLSGLL